MGSRGSLFSGGPHGFCEVVPLDDRKLEILRFIVLHYVATVEPVGSRTLARQYDLGVSPATIRNEMSDLEALGYLEQPHTSAGRVPSDLGYRLFVDRLMVAEEPSRRETSRIKEVYAKAAKEMEGLIRQTAEVLSETTSALSLVQGPPRDRVVLRALQIIPLRAGRAVLVLVTDEGLVENRIFDIPEHVGPGDLAGISGALTARLSGLTLGQITRGTIRHLQIELAAYRRVLDTVFELLHDDREDLDDEKVYTTGAWNLLRQPEFRDVEKAEALLNLLSRQDLLAELLEGPRRHGAKARVTIGGENPFDDLQDCSVITATYAVGHREMGKTAIIGPKRMNYGRMVSLVEMITQSLSEHLDRALR